MSRSYSRSTARVRRNNLPTLQPRWRLFWTSVPVAAALTALKLALDELLGFKGFLEFNSDLNVIFSALLSSP